MKLMTANKTNNMKRLSTEKASIHWFLMWVATFVTLVITLIKK